MSDEEFVTVVSVEDAPYVTVVEVEEPLIATEEASAVPPPVEEDIQIYRLPGERLGFGLKFDGGPTVSGLTIESTAEGSPSARARASWGPLGPGDSILEVDGRPVIGMSRQEVVGRLTESGLVVGLRIRRGPPPVPPRRQTRRRLPGPPPPPRPLPRAPPRLVDFLPKDNSRPVDTPIESAVLKCNVNETPHEIEINGGKQLYLDKDIEPDPQTDPIQFEESQKEKITPLKNLNPKLISLFEHSQPADNNIKTSQNAHFNNNKFWLNDEKSRKSVKDKIALFSSESENNFEYKLKKSESNERNENGKKGPKKLQASLSVPVLESESKNTNYLCSRISISENGEVINENEVSEKQENKINVQTVVSPADSQNMTTFIIGVDKTEEATHSEPFFLLDKVQVVNKEEKYNLPAEELSNAKSETSSCTSTYSCNSLPESRKKSSIYKEKNVSKLRGLVIPQTPSRVSSAEQILDLPEIKSASLFTKGDFCDVKDEILKDQYFKPKFQSSTMSLNRNSCSSGFEWKPQFDNEFPKYSPAFKRKALSVFEIRSNYTEGHLGNDVENSQEKPCGSWLLPLSKQDEKKSDSELILKDRAESRTKYYSKVQELPSEQDCNKYSSTLKTSGSREPDIELKTNEVLTSRNLGKDDNINYFITSQENHSESSSLTSNCSQFSNNIDPEKNKNFLDSKLDSLLSQDMSDSGNHSIPSNYSKSKCDSSDESMSSLVNGEIQDSDHTSLNSSSDEGQFLEFAYKNTEVLETKTKRHLATKVNTHSLDNFSILSNNMDDMKSNEKILDSSSTPLASQSVVKEIVKETYDNKFNEDSTDAKASAPLVDWAEKQEEPPRIPNKPDEYKESSEDVFHFRMPFPEKNNQTTSAFINKRAESKDFSADILPKEHIIDENISSLSSPISDLQKDNHFASITSLASSTSLISHQELCQLIEESNDSSMDDTNGCPEISVIVLHRDTAEGSIGITLAGGVDYECKDITVHKVLSGSPADRDGRIKKGHRILSINGKSMKGLTHAESLAVLKAPRHEVVLVVARSQGDLFEENNNISRAALHQSAEAEFPPACPFQTGGEAKWGPIIRIILTKEGAGLGFSLKGGKDSPSGDQPLTVQKIFTGGCAEKSKHIFAGDELLSINEYDLNGMTRVEAWTLMKRLPDGEVALKIRHPAHN